MKKILLLVLLSVLAFGKEFYTDTKEVSNPNDLLVLVNKFNYLPKDYKPGSYGEIIRQMKSNPAPIKRKINDEIILHEEKHKIEVELYDLKEKYLEVIKDM